jgi:hypothetical protein
MKYYEKYASSEVSLLAVGFGGNKEIGCKFQRILRSFFLDRELTRLSVGSVRELLESL